MKTVYNATKSRVRAEWSKEGISARPAADDSCFKAFDEERFKSNGSWTEYRDQLCA